MSGPTTVDDVLAAFPHPSLPKIQGRPTYEALHALRQQLRTNAASIPTALGGGQHGYAAITMTDQQYQQLTNQQFVTPAYPGVHPAIPANATGHQIKQLEREHKADLQQYQQYVAVQQALKKQLIQAIDPIYLKAQEDRVIGFANRTTLDLLTYLFATYAQITATDLLDNLTVKLVQPWDPSTPFETVIAQIEDCIEFAQDGGDPISPAQILNAAYTLVFNSGAYFEDLKEWDRKPAASRATWDQFKTFMHDAQQRMNRVNKAGGHNQFANAAFLANVETTVRDVLKENFAPTPAATENDSTLACMLTTQTELLKQIADLQLEIKNMKQNKPNPKQRRNRPRNHNNYCWTHGFRVGNNHTSATCFNPAPGHQTDATRNNRKGGSTAGMTNENLPPETNTE